MSLALGQAVTWDMADELVRRYVPGDWYAKRPSRKTWEAAFGTYRPSQPHPRTGVVVGVRTLANGTVESHYEEGTTFYPEERFTAVLVSYDLRRKPVYVKPEHLKES